ncbi:hypothetical protein [Amycolatopsis anabasis]|uniref:hypothetical protein n=1 Tax=Amycolatopsis anabasis TaxID=1840409 RepID=UPI00131E85B0|nr:hypothetical protein [Amycolatopsis anabasis]
MNIKEFTNTNGNRTELRAQWTVEKSASGARRLVCAWRPVVTPLPPRAENVAGASERRAG